MLQPLLLTVSASAAVETVHFNPSVLFCFLGDFKLSCLLFGLSRYLLEAIISKACSLLQLRPQALQFLARLKFLDRFIICCYSPLQTLDVEL